MFTRLRVQNFRCIGPEGIDLELKPLTILVGENGAGKSTLLQALALIAQTELHAQQGAGGLRLDGPWVALQPPDLACHRRVPATPISLGVEIEVPESELPEPFWAADHSPGPFDLDEMDPPTYRRLFAKGRHRLGYRFAYSLSGHESFKEFALEDIVIAKMLRDRALLPHCLDAKLRAPHSSVVSARAFDGLTLVAGPEKIRPWLEMVRSLGRCMADRLARSVRFLCAERGVAVARTSQANADLRLGPGRHGEHTIELLAHTFGPDGEPKAQERIGLWTERFGMARARAGWSAQVGTTFTFNDPLLEVKLSHGTAGYGSTQILAVITLLFASPPGSTLLVEEPEISLHPNAQLEVVRMLADAVGQGQQVILTTHSSVILMGLRRVMAGPESSLRAADVAVYEVRREKSGGAVANRLRLTEDGRLEGWVPSFAKAEDELWRDWYAAAGTTE